MKNLTLECDPRDLRRHRRGHPLAGEIRPGQVFAWEPYLPYAAELVVVTDVTEDCVYSRLVGEDRITWTDLDRFREAAVRTILNDMPIVRPKIVPVPDWLTGRP